PLDENLKPGMTMGPYGVHWDRGQTWWSMVRPYHDYIARCQFMLSQGQPVADILYLTPEGAPQVFRPPAGAMDGTEILPDKKEYAFDGCSPTALIKLAKAQSGRIVFPGGASYRLMVLPALETMTPELLSKIEELVREGAQVVGSPPKRSPSLENYPECDMRVKEIAEKIWGSLEWPKDLTGHQYGRGKIFFGGRLSPEPVRNNSNPLEARLYPDYQDTVEVLKQIGVRPDFTCRTGKIRYTHRSLSEEGCQIYFISNRTGEVVEDVCRFRAGSLSAELWDPVTGEIRKLESVGEVPGGVEIGVRLEPHQSYFIVFEKGLSAPESEIEYENESERKLQINRGEAEKKPMSSELGGRQLEGKKAEIEEAGKKNLEFSNSGKVRQGPEAGLNDSLLVRGENNEKQQQEQFREAMSRNFPKAHNLMEISGPWKVWFDPKWGGPGEVIFEKLIDWSKHPAEGIRYYSGTAVYTVNFDLPAGIKISRGDRLYLDLGEVQCLARVKLNGKELGVVWTRPPRLPLTGRLKKKGNQLEIEVANLWVNRMIGDENEPWDGVENGKWPEWLLKGQRRPTRRYTFAPHRFYKQGDPLLPSGLLGPVLILKNGETI
ncbi:MAG: hypothetical protein H5U07_10405, partial [Candidatus Aminicenantes bacterium]|nr:hypothetical protein [Candidatus Aminicenantes bacterium]